MGGGAEPRGRGGRQRERMGAEEGEGDGGGGKSREMGREGTGGAGNLPSLRGWRAGAGLEKRDSGTAGQNNASSALQSVFSPPAAPARSRGARGLAA